ncbi:MAG: hypothetical protein LC746_05055 [Acidobacteria bacterium]|nr:hypothetical protein [Acidobacteriota bacterium]
MLHEGRNQQIRRMFDAVGHSVLKLRRVRIGNLRDERLPVGAWRHLTPAEVAGLKRGGAGRVRSDEGGAKEARGGGARGRRATASDDRARDDRARGSRRDAAGGGSRRRVRERESSEKSARGAAKARGAGHVRGE